jgi:23S rRNA (uridine2552-2'-O)-methyltransferase
MHRNCARHIVRFLSSTAHRWLNEHVNDKWVKDAQKAGYRSRAAFKLLQLQEADTLLKPGQVVLDLGSAPGSWSQVARKLLGPTGKIIATDILEMKSLPGVTFIQGDFLEDFARGEIALALNGSRADVILSDMAPNLSGNSIIDQGRAFNLVELAMFMCQSWLKTGGSFACKVFQGEGYDECLATMKEQFTSVKIRKPKASRERSSELFLVGTGFIKDDSKARDAGKVQNEAVGDWAIGDAPPSEESREAAGANTRKKKKLDDLMDGMLG